MSVDEVIQHVVETLKPVPGLRAIVLGGSRARGTHTPASDVDLGLYYDPSEPLDMTALRQAATQLDDRHLPGVVNTPGDWGPWINGGGWLQVRSQPVDLLYRDLEKVQQVIVQCLAGEIEIAYQPGHPFGFPSSIYLAEVAVCSPLWDPSDLLPGLKALVHPYPAGLRRAVINRFHWEINFSIDIARKGIERADAAYAAGCCFRSVMCMLQVLFALNGEHWLNEKGAVQMAEGFAIMPRQFKERVEVVFYLLEAVPGSIQRAVDLLSELSAEIDEILKQA